MSQENVERVRRGYDAFNEGRVPAMVDEFYAPEIVYDMTPMGIPGFGIYEGAEGIAAFMEEWLGAFAASDWHIEVVELIDLGERVAAVVCQRGQGASSGVAVELEFVQVITVQDGKAIHIDNYSSRQQALEAAELGE